MRIHATVASIFSSALIVSAALPAAVWAQAPVYLGQWGSFGSGPGQFNSPMDIAVDDGGNVYVVEARNRRVQKFTSAGAYLAQWGTEGSGDGQFYGDGGVAVDASGFVYVADSGNHRVQKFTSDGTYLLQWGTQGTGDGEFVAPARVAVDAMGNVYVTDPSTYLGPRISRVQKFSGGGSYLTKWGTYGSGNAQFMGVWSIAADHSGSVYVVDYDNHRIQKFTSDGDYITQWGTAGSGNGQFGNMGGVAVDGAGNVYVTDAYPVSGSLLARVQVFNNAGTFLTSWGRWGSQNGQFLNPAGIAVDGSGNVYVADRGNHRVQVFGPVPTPAKPTSWGRMKALFR